MRLRKRNIAGVTVLALAAGFSLAQTTAGQERTEAQEDVLMFAPAQAEAPVPGTFDKMIWRSDEGPGSSAAKPMFTFISAGAGFGGPTVKGSPYSAEAVTEIEQRLADGNRISRKTSSSVYRDSEGRTRRDQTLGAVGPWVVSEQMPRMSTIHDPVAGVSYMLDHTHQTARRMPMLAIPDIAPMMGEVGESVAAGVRHARVAASTAIAQAKTAAASALAGAEPAQVGVRVEPFIMPVPPPMPMPMPGGSGVWVGGGVPDPSRFRSESLGKQMVEGVEAEGTRSVFTIPAGEIGNDFPIEVVSERWYSPELQTVVLSRNKDPRMGETVYRLTNLQRADPARSLFEIPPGYTLIDPRTANSFESCAAAGHPVLESDPRQCRTPDGRSFVETRGH